MLKGFTAINNMAALSETQMGKVQRKHVKKVARIKKQLAKNENVIVCEGHTKIVCVQNGGLDNGVSQADLHPLFTSFGPVQDIIMIPRKPYCFVCYNSSDAAALAVEKLTGHLLREGKDPSQNITLYVFFVATAPPSVCSCAELPPGLLLLEDFISKETEQGLLQELGFEDQDVSCSGSGSSLKHRTVKHYGYEFKYGINNVDPKEPLPESVPDVCLKLIQRAKDERIVAHMPDQLTVNRYLPGQGIPSHVDTPSAFEDGIMSLSCGSQVIMDFQHPDGRHMAVLVPARSLLVMTGESRYIWSHGITPRKSDIITSARGGLTLQARGVRTSFTFRKLSPTAGMTMEEPKDSGLKYTPTTDKEASDLESRHVHNVYEEIASHFSDTRHKPWPEITKFLQAQEPGSILVDIGCGNGKYFGHCSQLYEIGSDRSQNLAGICASRGFQCFVGDVLAIPLRSNSVDVGLCIAVIHHLSTRERRKQAIEELVRILRYGGSILIYVWALEQQKDNKKSKYLLKPKDCRQQSKAIDQLCKADGSGDKALREHDGCELKSTMMPSASEKTQISRDASQQRVVLSGNTVDRESQSANQAAECSYSSGSKERLKNEHRDMERPGDTKSVHSLKQTDVESDQTHGEQESLDSGQVLQVHVNRTEFKQQDLLVPWKLKTQAAKDSSSVENHQPENQTFQRFYHVFRQGELENLCADVNTCVVKKSYYDQGNWCVVLEKCLK